MELRETQPGFAQPSTDAQLENMSNTNHHTKGAKVNSTRQQTKMPRSATGLFALLGGPLSAQRSGAPKIAKGSGASLVGAIVVLALLAILALPGSSALATGDVNHPEACPSEAESSPGFRSYMPDCRGYELVTPPYVGGQVPFGQGDNAKLPQISPNGEHVLSISYAGFAGAENDEQSGLEYGTTYEYSRTATGWKTEALDPPASQYPRRNFLMGSANLERMLWGVYIPARENEELPPFLSNNAEILAIREPAGNGKGRFTQVGPLTAPGHEPETEANSSSDATVVVEGAAANLEDIVFEVQAVDRQLWPGDETEPGKWSLYEYASDGAVEPVLVAVKNGGALHGTPHVNEGAELISKCGTELGSVKIASSYNAVSAAGNVVYFTALECPGGPLVNELYARVNAEETVAISEPSTGLTGNCEACEETVRKPAVFEGASEDGSQVFFLSEQALLAGAKGDSLYEYNFHAANPHERLSLVAPDVTVVTNPTEDGRRVYFQSPDQLTLASNANGEQAVETHNNLYVYDTAEKRIAYVAQEPSPIDTTHDGQFAVFESPVQLTGTGDTSTVAQLFEYDANTGRVTRVSIGQASAAGYKCATTGLIEAHYNCDGNTSEDPPVMVKPTQSAETFPSPNRTSDISVANNGMVVFESRDALAPFAVAGGENLYEYRENNVYLIAIGEEAVSVQDSEASRLYGTDESGNDVFFRSTESLVPQDTDSQASFYDAREDGGFPRPAATPSCVQALCQGSPTGAPVFAAPGSDTLTASGNLAPPAEPKPAVRAKPKARAKACKKGYKRQRGKCVKGRKANQAKRAGAEREARS